MFASIPTGHSVTRNENYDCMKIVLKKMQSEERNWTICGDLKVIGLFLGLQDGYTTYPSSLCSGTAKPKKQPLDSEYVARQAGGL